MPSLRRSIALGCTLALPWLWLACALVPLGPAVDAGTGGGSTGAGGGGATTTAGASTSSGASSSTTTTSSHSNTGGQTGSGGATGSGGTAGAGGHVETGGGHGHGGGGSPADAGPPPCDTTVTKYAIDPSPHIPDCWPVLYSSNPPTSGPHYPIWAAFKTYTTPVPRGFTVHGLEHGAIVISYNCPGGCDEDLAALAAWLDARPADPLCFAPLKARIIVTPDPDLDVRFAAASWGWALRSGCFDLSLLGPFIDAHYAQAPENFCFDGTDVTAPDAGIPPDCGHSFPDGG